MDTKGIHYLIDVRLAFVSCACLADLSRLLNYFDFYGLGSPIRLVLYILKKETFLISFVGCPCQLNKPT